MTDEPTSLLHLVAACRTDKERAELSLLLAHASLGLAAMMESNPDKKEVPVRMMTACRDACRVLAETVLGTSLSDREGKPQ